MLKECPVMWDRIQKADARQKERPPAGMKALSADADHGITVALLKPLLWSCAADKIAEAERLVK